MSGLLSSLFGGGSRQVEPQGQQGQQGQNVLPAQSNVLPPAPQPGDGTMQNQNVTVPNDNTVRSDGSHSAFPAAAPGTEADPLEKFKDLWKKDPAATPVKDITKLSLGVDPAKLNEIVSGMDFSSHFDTALMQKATQGDATALAQLLNKAVQTGFAQSMTANTKLVESSVNQQVEAMIKQIIPQVVQRNLTSQQIRTDNPMMNDPAVAPILDAIGAQLRAKNPTASPQEIASNVNTFLDGMANHYAKTKGMQFVAPNQGNGSGNSNQRQEEDWSKFFGLTL